MKLRGAISGFGQVAALGHLPGWRTRESVELVAVHEPLASRRHEALRLIRGVRVYEDLELMLDGERLDFLDVASPPAHHLAAVELALEAGLHVLVEKPLCLSLDDFDRIVALATAKRRALLCVHNWKHAPAYRRAGALLAAGRLGALRYAALTRLRTEPARGVAEVSPAEASGETHRSPSSSNRANRASWRLAPTVGGGILVDHGWHVLYLMRWLMGNTAPETVSARLSLRPDSGLDEAADLSLAFPGGRTGYAHLSWLAPVRRSSARLYGDDAMLEIEGESVVLTERSGRRHDLSVSDAADDSYHSAWFGAVAAEFERAVAGGEVEAEVNLAEAGTALRSILAARESHRRGGAPVTVSG